MSVESMLTEMRDLLRDRCLEQAEELAIEITLDERATRAQVAEAEAVASTIERGRVAWEDWL